MKSVEYLNYNMKIEGNILLIYVDLFCGAGGTTTGVEAAELCGSKVARVIACVNHDKLAIDSHASNHPHTLHFTEDIRTMDVQRLNKHVNRIRVFYPNAALVLWASLECTNYSKAKGGQPRDADSRTLADHLDRYILELQPDFIQIENVREFMAWGEIDVNGRPLHMKKGVDYLKWRDRIKSYGYDFDYRLLDSANFGALTSRVRYFGQFAKEGFQITWPEATHSKTGIDDPRITQINAFDEKPLRKWRAVKEVLDFNDEGNSIFDRKTPLSEKTMERIWHGLIKYVAGGEKYFISKYFSGKPQSKNIPITGPAGTVKTKDGQALVKCCFIQKYNSNNYKKSSTPADINEPCPVVTTQVRMALCQAKFLISFQYNDKGHDVNEPCPTLLTKDRHAIIQPKFMTTYYGNGGVNSVDEPAPTITTKDRVNIISCDRWIDKQYSGSANHQSIDTPAGTITGNPKLDLMTCDRFLMDTNFNNHCRSIEDPSPVITANTKHHYLVNPQFKCKGSSVESPCFTLIARMDKRPPSIVTTELGEIAIQINESDSKFTAMIKEFMAHYGIIDIKMRMLKIEELKPIMGFPANYILRGSKADQKRFIGNAVETTTARKLAEATASCIHELKRVAV
jgi:DNA (cytosine-5)-methyltransferase 1